MALEASIHLQRVMQDRDARAWRQFSLWVESDFIKSGGARVREKAKARIPVVENNASITRVLHYQAWT